MSKFCPFINGDCKDECTFYNNCYEEREPESCVLYDAADMIRSLGFDDTKLSDYIENIDNHIGNIVDNTGSDQTESGWINTRLSSIENTLDEIKEKINNIFNNISVRFTLLFILDSSVFF